MGSLRAAAPRAITAPLQRARTPVTCRPRQAAINAIAPQRGHRPLSITAALRPAVATPAIMEPPRAARTPTTCRPRQAALNAIAPQRGHRPLSNIGRASRRERVGQYVKITEAAVKLQK